MRESDGTIQELEQRIAELQAKLNAAQGELESFTYAVSHDLRAPLRSISGYCQILQEDLAPQLDEQHRHFLSRVQDSALKLGELIDALLELSRVARAEVHTRPLDLSTLLEQAAATQRTRYPHARPTIAIAPGMRACADPRLTQLAFEHLIGNAIKFSAARSDASIDVTQRLEGTRAITCVRDNGVGFDMKYAGKLFVPFQRLHSEPQFAGVGIGLALVQRLLARQNGSIRMEAQPGRGAAFFVDLPAE